MVTSKKFLGRIVPMVVKGLNHPDRFCFVCGKFTSKKQQRNITHDVKKMYAAYFGCPLGDQDKTWAPHKICKICCLGLNNWLNKRSPSMPFSVPMIWREPKDHCQDCYFCLTKTKGFSFKQRDKITYPNLDSARTPVSHDDSCHHQYLRYMDLTLLIAVLMNTTLTD